MKIVNVPHKLIGKERILKIYSISQPRIINVHFKIDAGIILYSHQKIVYYSLGSYDTSELPSKQFFLRKPKWL